MRRGRDGFEFNGEWYSVGVHGYYVGAGGAKKYHRELWSMHNGPIPGGCIVHHKNGDKLDNRLENLELMAWGDHSTHHNHERESHKNLQKWHKEHSHA